MANESTPDDGAEEESTSRRLVVNSPSFQTVYSNAVSMLRTPFDIRVNFGLSKAQQASEPTDGPIQMVNEQQVTVLMSPHHAKIFALIFITEIKKWEEQFGPIPISPEFAERVGIKIVEGGDVEADNTEP